MNWTKIFGIDTEFLSSGRRDDPSHVHSIQVWNPGDQRFFTDPEDFKRWLNLTCPELFFTWTTKPEFGSVRAWGLLGIEHKEGSRYEGVMHPWKKIRYWESFSEKPIAHFYIPYIKRYTRRGEKKKKIKRACVFDIRAFFHQMRYKNYSLGSVEAAGAFLTDQYQLECGRDHSTCLHKLAHPLGEEFGLRAPKPEEMKYFERYAMRDAEITFHAGRWFYENILSKYCPGVRFEELYSFGTLARHYFNYPKINEGYRIGRNTYIVLKPSHEEIFRHATFAGRVEAFKTGYVGDVFYLDFSSLYPVEAVRVESLNIADVTPMDRRELEGINKVEDVQPFGWLRGLFYTKGDYWGLPVKDFEVTNRNYYVTGQVEGLFHTYDLLASNAKILRLDYGYLPVFKKNREMDKYYKLTLKKLEGDYESIAEKFCIKGILNSSVGKQGGSHPISVYSNFPAYNSVVAASHYDLSRLIKKMQNSGNTVHYIDTDSVFVDRKWIGVFDNITSCSGEYTVPLEVDLKGVSEFPGTMIFRKKMYWQNELSNAYGGWKPYYSYFRQICLTLPDNITVRRQVTKGYLTRIKKIAEFEVGRFMEVKETLDLNKLQDLFEADYGRKRSNYDSYLLAKNRLHVDSEAWDLSELQKFLWDRKGKMKVVISPNGTRTVWDSDAIDEYLDALPDSGFFART